MNELYWITRLEAIHILTIIFGVILTILFLVFLANYIFESEYKDTKNMKRQMSNIRKTSIPLFLCVLILIFVPTKEEALLIYGVGGTIDYIKTNDKVKKLPDKVIDALDLYLEEHLGKNKKEK